MRKVCSKTINAEANCGVKSANITQIKHFEISHWKINGKWQHKVWRQFFLRAQNFASIISINLPRVLIQKGPYPLCPLPHQPTIEHLPLCSGPLHFAPL